MCRLKKDIEMMVFMSQDHPLAKKEQVAPSDLAQYPFLADSHIDNEDTRNIIALSPLFPINGYFNSMGYSWFIMFHSLLTTFAFRILLVWLFSRLENATMFTIGLAPPLSSLVSLLLCAFFLRRVTRSQSGPKPPAHP